MVFNLMTSGRRKDIQCHVGLYSFLGLQIIIADIRPQVKCDVNLVIADGHFHLP